MKPMRFLPIIFVLTGCSSRIQLADNCEASRDTAYGTVYECLEPPRYGELSGDCEAVPGDPRHEILCWIALPSAISPRCFLSPSVAACDGVMCVGTYNCPTGSPDSDFIRPDASCEVIDGTFYRCAFAQKGSL